ncbi:MAG: tRNA lysidine(34) synthetase TilS, partial [Gemmatimonadota bacterium]
MRDERVGGAGSRCAAGLPERFDNHLRASRLLPEGAAVTVALSGGLDSVALLDLLGTLRERWGWRLTAAHFDHRMREESGADAGWVADLCRQRGVPCRVGRARRVPRSESEARDLRYEFLHRARLEFQAECLATAHQADDQAETVLFRLLRGSGLAGLGGIPLRRSPNIVRPLLPFWRAEIEAYAAARGLAHRSDPTNLDISIARNRIRHQLIPAIEANDAPDFRGQLVRL